MRNITLLRTFGFVFFGCNIVTCYGQNAFTGTFIANSRPREMMFLNLTQTENHVAGSLIIVTPDDHGSTTSDTLSLRGTTDGAAITLTANRLFGNLVINGRKDGASVKLIFPGDSGKISSIIFLPGSENDYNLLLRQWHDNLAATHNESEKILSLASALSEDINAIKSTRINQNLGDIKSHLEDERTALQDLESDLADLKDDASISPMTCYQVSSTLAYDYSSRMAHTYNSSLGYAYNKFMSGVQELEKRLSNVNPKIEQIKQESHALEQAIAESKHPLRKLNVIPGDEKQVLEQYLTLANSVRNELPTLKAAHSDVLNKAKGIIHEGESILKQAQALVRCN